MENDWPADGSPEQGADAGPSIDDLVAQNPPALQDILAGAVADPRKSVRIEAALHLADLFQDVRAVPALAEALDENDRQTRKSASNALWELGDTNTPGLISLLEQSYGPTRDLIASALSRIGWQADDPDSDILYLIAIRDWRGCVILGSKAVPGLLSALRDPEGAVRRAAAWSLGEIG